MTEPVTGWLPRHRPAPRPEARPSQERRILHMLRAAGTEGICISNVPLELGYTMRNRISELRQKGYTIERELCRAHNHRAAVLRYTLKEEP